MHFLVALLPSLSSERGARRAATWLALAALTACSSDEAGKWVGDYVTVNDFEAVRGWGADAAAVTPDHAHSGQYAAFVGPEREYGLTYDLPLSQASVRPLRGVVVEAWAYLPSAQAAASLEVQVRLPGAENNLGFAGRLALPEQVKEYAVWTRVRQEFAFPAGLPGDAHLRIFLWRSGSREPVYLDDLRVKALE